MLLMFNGLSADTAPKMNFSIKDFFSKCDQIHRKLRIWSHFVKKSLMENFIFCAVWRSVICLYTIVHFYHISLFHLHFFHVSISSHRTVFMLHFLHDGRYRYCSLVEIFSTLFRLHSFIVLLFPCWVFWMAHSFLVDIFYVAFMFQYFQGFFFFFFFWILHSFMLLYHRWI